jgi:transposase
LTSKASNYLWVWIDRQSGQKEQRITEVARRNGVAASVVFTWRRQARTAGRVMPCFAPVRIAAAVETGEENSKPRSEDDRRLRQLPAARNGPIEIDLGNRQRIRVDAQFDPEALARVGSSTLLERR